MRWEIDFACMSCANCEVVRSYPLRYSSATEVSPSRVSAGRSTYSIKQPLRAAMAQGHTRRSGLTPFHCPFNCQAQSRYRMAVRGSRSLGLAGRRLSSVSEAALGIGHGSTEKVRHDLIRRIARLVKETIIFIKLFYHLVLWGR